MNADYHRGFNDKRRKNYSHEKAQKAQKGERQNSERTVNGG
jgi:hypothetical protein